MHLHTATGARLSQRQQHGEVSGSKRVRRPHGFGALRLGQPMPLGFYLIPKGCLIIAQRFNVGLRLIGTSVPKGRLTMVPPFSRPFGTRAGPGVRPNAEALGYYRMSLRDKTPVLEALDL